MSEGSKSLWFDIVRLVGIRTVAVVLSDEVGACVDCSERRMPFPQR
jgi:hypothetical protein